MRNGECGLRDERSATSRSVSDMRSKIFTIDSDNLHEAFTRCRDVINKGGIIAYPTDTFYGLGADPRNAAAIRKLFSIKGRDAGKPILLLIRDRSEVGHWAQTVSARAHQLMDRFWPGPLTLVFKARPDVLPELTAGMGTIGLRVPGNELTRSLLDFLGSALTGTSANVSGGRHATTADEVADSGIGVDLILDQGALSGTLPSTIVNVETDEPIIIRAGTIPVRDITG